MDLIKIKEARISSTGQITIPSFFKKKLSVNSLSIYLTKINGIESLVLLPISDLNIQQTELKNLKKIQEKQ